MSTCTPAKEESDLPIVAEKTTTPGASSLDDTRESTDRDTITKQNLPKFTLLVFDLNGFLAECESEGRRMPHPDAVHKLEAKFLKLQDNGFKVLQQENVERFVDCVFTPTHKGMFTIFGDA